MRVLRSAALAWGILLALTEPLFAQTSMGTVDGTVTDSTGSAVPGATVTLISVTTNIQAVRATNDRGYFTFVNVRPGSYRMTIELQGFKTVQIAPFTVGVNETVARNAAMEVGALTESVQVFGGSELLQTSTSELGNVVEERVIQDLPLQGRNFTSLLMLTPGVNPVSTAQGPQEETGFGTEGNSGIPGGQIINASVQGQQNRSKIYYMDGIVNTSMRAGTYVAMPDIDSLQEFKVQSHSDKAEFGGVTGGVVNMTSKSGSNRLTGGGFGLFRNENLAARNPFRDAGAAKPPVFRQYQFGASTGGPILKDRTFFFASYDGWNYRDVQAIRHTVPTEAELNGDFSHAFHGRAIYNPYTTRVVSGKLVRDPFPGNVIPRELNNPLMQSFLKAYMVQPNLPGEVRDNFRNTRERTNVSNSFNVRVDHHFSAGDNLFFRWTERRISIFNPIGDRGSKTPYSINRNFGGGWFHSFSPNVILETRGGLATQPTEDAPLEHELGVAPQQNLGLPELSRFYGYFATGFTPWSLPAIGVQGPRVRGNPNWNAAADLSWLRGNHTFKGGFQILQISRLQKNQFGQLNFSTESTRDPQRTSTTGDALASALLGIPSRIQGFVPDLGSIDFHTGTVSGYVEDQWAMKQNLTFTYGLRYDYIMRATGKGLQSGVDMNTGDWLIALPTLPDVCAGQAPPCLPAPLEQIPFHEHIRATGEEFSILKPITDNWGPRAGLAWQIRPGTVVRSGYSLMWDSMVSRSQYGQHQFESWGWPQFSGIDTGDINREGEPLQTLGDVSSLPFAKPDSSPWNHSGYYNDPNRKNAYSHQWQMEVQRELTRNMLAAVGYVGSYNGRMEYSGRAAAPEVAAVDPATGRRLLPAERNQLRPYPYITGSLTYETDHGMARYNALQAKLQRRFSRGWASTVSYTFSRSIDTSSGWFDAENGIGGRAQVQNFYDIDGARGLSSYDVPHILTWAAVVELPVGRGKALLNSGPASWILGDWQLSWNFIARSGQPFTPTVDGDPATLGFNGYSRPNLIGDPKLSSPTTEEWFNVAAFEAPVNSFGNAGRNLLRVPAYWNADLGLQRNVPIGAGRNLQIRAEVFNVFNHINLGNPNVNISSTSAGSITSMRGHPREAQFGLRLRF
jgi:outer membrane receptor protein involved in Fe transport